MYDEELLNKYSKRMLSWAKSLWPMNRSLTGEGNLKTLNFIKLTIFLLYQFLYLQITFIFT